MAGPFRNPLTGSVGADPTIRPRRPPAAAAPGTPRALDALLAKSTAVAVLPLAATVSTVPASTAVGIATSLPLRDRPNDAGRWANSSGPLPRRHGPLLPRRERTRLPFFHHRELPVKMCRPLRPPLPPFSPWKMSSKLPPRLLTLAPDHPPRLPWTLLHRRLLLKLPKQPPAGRPTRTALSATSGHPATTMRI